MIMSAVPSEMHFSSVVKNLPWFVSKNLSRAFIVRSVHVQSVTKKQCGKTVEAHLELGLPRLSCAWPR